MYLKQKIKLQKTYEFRRGDRMIHKGDLSDLYIRLESHPCTNGKTYYTLVLDGFMVSSNFNLVPKYIFK